MTKRCPRSGKKSKDELPAITLNPGALSHLHFLVAGAPRPAGTDSLHGGNKMIYKPASISPDFRPRRMALMLCGFLLVSTIFSPLK
jgi:hypothetical protein